MITIYFGVEIKESNLKHYQYSHHSLHWFQEVLIKRMILIKMRMENIFEDMNRYKITMFKLTRLPGSDFDMY